MSGTAARLPPVIPSDIYHATEDCRKSLQQCLTVEELMIDQWAENRLADFNLWDAGVGASAKPQASLDMRLSRELEAREVVTGLLLTLNAYIEQCKQLVIHQNLPIPPPDSDVLDEERDGKPKRSEDSMSVNEAKEGIDGLLEELVRLGVAIRKAGTTARHRQADSNFKAEDHQDLEKYLIQILLGRPFDIEVLRKQQAEEGELVIDKAKVKLDFSEGKDSLTPVQKHLIQANLKRRNRFVYARQHGERLGTHRNQKVSRKIRPDPRALTKETAKPTIDSEVRSQFTAGGKPKHKDLHWQEDLKSPPSSGGQSINTKPSELSQILDLNTPVAPRRALSQITTTSRKIEYPQPPLKFRQKRPFKCPCCWQTQPSNMIEDEWKKHLTDDLCPYTCLFPDCPKQFTFYITREAWKAHMDKEHQSRPYWKCFACKESPEKFHTGESFTDHIKDCHPNIISDAQLPMLAEMYEERDPTEFEACPLCPWAEEQAWKLHMEEVHHSLEYWECCKGSQKFDNEDDFTIHVTEFHHIALEDLPEFVEMCQMSEPPPDRSCPLCAWAPGKENMIDPDSILNHIAEHVHNFSLHALPWAAITEEEEKEGEIRAKKAVHMVDNWLLKDWSLCPLCSRTEEGQQLIDPDILNHHLQLSESLSPHIINPKALLDHITEHMHSFSPSSSHLTVEAKGEEIDDKGPFQQSTEVVRDWILSSIILLVNDTDLQNIQLRTSKRRYAEFYMREDSKRLIYHFGKDEYFAEDVGDSQVARHEGEFGHSKDMALIENLLDSLRKAKADIPQDEDDTPQFTQEDLFPSGQIDGLQVIRNPANSDVDIIFIHGETGNSYSTWVQERSGIYWPIQLLSEDIPTARIMTFSCEFKFAPFIGPLVLSEELSRFQEENDSVNRKAVFIAHGLGGFVIMQALVSEHNTNLGRHLGYFTLGLIFLGVPHQKPGNFYEYAYIASLNTENPREFSEIEHALGFLIGTGGMFTHWVHRSENVKLACFYEEAELLTIKKVFRADTSRIVVDRESAIIEGYPVLGINADHIDIAKFGSRNDQGYQLILSELKNWLNPATRQQRLETPFSTEIDMEIMALEQELKTMAVDDPSRASRFNNLGLCFSNRFELRKEMDDIDSAIKSFANASDLYGNIHNNLIYRTNLGEHFSIRFKFTGDIHDIDRAIESFQSACIARSSSSDYPIYLNKLAKCYGMRYDHTGNIEDIDLAVKALSEALQRLEGHEQKDILSSFDEQLSKQTKRWHQDADLSFDPSNFTDLSRYLHIILKLWERDGSGFRTTPQEATIEQHKLIDHNLRRRNRFIYAQRRAEIQKNSDYTTQAKENELTAGLPIKAELPTVAPLIGITNEPSPTTSITALTKATTFIQGSIADQSKASYLHLRRPSYPLPPKFEEGSQTFKCPCCCRILPKIFSTKHRWMRHLVQDMSPYSCIENCESMFTTQQDWLAHLTKDHNSGYWVGCPLCGSLHDNPEDLMMHISEHIHSFSLESLPWASEMIGIDKRSYEKVNNWLEAWPIPEDILTQVEGAIYPKPVIYLEQKPDDFVKYFQGNEYFGGSVAEGSDTAAASSLYGMVSEWDSDMFYEGEDKIAEEQEHEQDRAGVVA